MLYIWNRHTFPHETWMNTIKTQSRCHGSMLQFYVQMFTAASRHCSKSSLICC